MPLDPAILKARWGVTDPALDPLVEQVAAQAQALCETYTGRRFDLADDAGDFEPVNFSFQVPRYPIDSISQLHAWTPGQVPADQVPGAAITSYRADKARGLVWPGAGISPGFMVHCAWRGGFATWPADLDFAVTAAADIVWSDTPGGGAAAGSAGGASLGAVKKISVVGVYSAELSEGGDAGGGGDGDNQWGVLPPSVTAVLDRYRVAALIGIG